MAEERLKQLYEDRKAMVDILNKHGLLLLPEDVLKRNVKANVRTFANQIKKVSSYKSYTTTAGTAVTYIRRLGHMPDGRLKAMELLLEVADRFCDANGEWNFGADWYYDGSKDLEPMDRLMCDLVREQYISCQTSKVDWFPIDLLDEIDELQGERIPCDIDFGSCDMRDRENVFEEARGLMEIVCERRAATMLANKVTGHILPPELVDMVKDCLCSDEQSRAVGGR